MLKKGRAKRETAKLKKETEKELKKDKKEELKKEKKEQKEASQQHHPDMPDFSDSEDPVFQAVAEAEELAEIVQAEVEAENKFTEAGRELADPAGVAA